MNDGFTWFLVALSVVIVLGLVWMVLEATDWTPRPYRRPYDWEADESLDS